MADQAIPAVSTTPASTTVVAATPTTPTLATAQPIQDPVATNEQARLAAQGLSVVQSGNNQPVWTPLTSEGMEEDTRYRCPSLGGELTELPFAD